MTLLVRTSFACILTRSYDTRVATGGPDEQIAGQELGERTHHLLKAIDGIQTLEQIATSTGIPTVEAMKIAASLLAAGIVRVS